MIPNENAIFLFKFGEYRWMKRFIDGDVNFACPGAFIHQAIISDNDVQGDRFEGVFARLKNGDAKISEMKQKLGNDLEIIDDKEYKMLRRKSAQRKPIFCFYGYKAEDLLIDGDVDRSGYKLIRHEFDNRIYSGFADSINLKVISDSHRFTQVTLQPKPFMDRIKLAMANNNLQYKMKPVDYELFSKDTFFIEPTGEYEELFHKFPKYRYQLEGRICITGISFNTILDRYSLGIIPLT